MILVRDIFHLKFGKAREAKEELKKMKEFTKKKEGFELGKLMTDLTGKSYTIVMETEFESLSDFEQRLKKAFSDKEWHEMYQRFVPLVESGEREIYTIVD